MPEIFTKKIFYLPAVLILAATVYLVGFQKSAPKYEVAVVSRGTLLQEVSLTGSVKPIQTVSLSFERSGRIRSTPVSVGDRVEAGQTLVSLDATTEVLALREAEAKRAEDEATLVKLQKGMREEDIAVLLSKYNAASLSLADTKRSLANTIKDAYTRSDDAVRNYCDQFFDNPRSSSPVLNISANDSQLKTNLNRDRLSVEQVLSTWQMEVGTLLEAVDLAVPARTAERNLILVGSFLDELASVVNALTPSQSLSGTTITTYRSNISTARASVNTGLTNLSTGTDSYSTAVSNLDLAQKNLAVGKAGSAPEEIQAAEARVLGDEASIASARHAISISSLYAPFDAIVTKQDGKIGQIVSLGTPLVSLIGEGFEIEANVPEADIAKLSIGQHAKVTLDAYGSDTFFEAVVTKIDPAETLIDNVATYKVTFNFAKADPRIKSGMTANLDVETARKENALLAPVRSVKERDGEKFVRIPTASGATTERVVQTGLKSSDGQIEILSGLSEGDTVVVGG